MKAHHTREASIQPLPHGVRLTIEGGEATQYRGAQLDDYSTLQRKNFPHQSVSLTLQARVSRAALLGTWGFGVWNDPFGFSLGFGGSPFRIPALPNAAWFFHASPENHLSFCDAHPGNGFLAQTFHAPAFHPLLFPAGLTFPFHRKKSRDFLSKVIREDALRLETNVTAWHTYQIEWARESVTWRVDDQQVFRSSISPRPPLGIVIWIDNQFARFTPGGEIASGILKSSDSWLEIEHITTGIKK